MFGSLVLREQVGRVHQVGCHPFSCSFLHGPIFPSKIYNIAGQCPTFWSLWPLILTSMTSVRLPKLEGPNTKVTVFSGLQVLPLADVHGQGP